MIEDLHAVAQWHMNEDHATQLSINYINRENELVGNIDVDTNGNMSWEIINLEYKDFFCSLLPYLYNGDIEEHISNKSIASDPLRWTRTRVYLAKNNIPIKYSQEQDEMDESRSMFR